MNRLVLMFFKNIWIVPGAFWKLNHYAKHTDKYSEEEKYAHIQYMFKKAVKGGNVDLQIYGKENIPEADGFMMYANHQGLFDILAITASFDKPWAAVMKKELYNLPMLKQMARCTKSLSLDREDVRQGLEVIRAVTKEVESGRNYLIFPEGKRCRSENRMLEFHKGSFRCALKAKCPILPIALIDSYKVLDQKGSKRVTVQIHYLEPIFYEEYKDMNTAALAEMVHDRIEKVIKEKENTKSFQL